MPDSKQEMEQTIRQLFAGIFESQMPAEPVPELRDETVLLDTGLDSLGFANLERASQKIRNPQRTNDR
ncbi:hypothetical protein [Palleronia caenipelagi]|uniref:Acyl carrier protein n=1 Tax=Palleronia caenipelagi TaxID=2489174 RepID=A0A547PLC2_9RHOB|nr:hypothetical protein [Palleronia caenipelagi]TRD14948.1 hypothetical protein FEV53_18025 [Palleronia caenipelagi]